MDHPNHFAENLNAIKDARRKTLSEFSDELGIPKSTLQSILKDGQTTLDTAIRISNALHIPIDTLVNGTLPAEELSLLHAFCESFTWFGTLSKESKKAVAFHLNQILTLLGA